MMDTRMNQMHTVFVLVLVTVLLTGCTTVQYGNFIQNPSRDASQVMADDAVIQIVRLYPAATTQFTMLHAVNDPFGQTLIEKLRLNGFAVQEVPESIQQSLFVAPQSKPESQVGIKLSYIVDQSDDLLHANLLINDVRLSRAFIAGASGIVPAGLWVKKE